MELRDLDNLISAWEAAVKKYPRSQSCKEMLRHFKKQREELIEGEVTKLMGEDSQPAPEPEPTPEQKMLPAPDNKDPLKEWELNENDRTMLRKMKIKPEDK